MPKSRRRKRKASRRARVEPVSSTNNTAAAQQDADQDNDENTNTGGGKKIIELNEDAKSKYKRVIYEQYFYGFLQAIGIGVDLKNYFSSSNESGYPGLEKLVSGNDAGGVNDDTSDDLPSKIARLSRHSYFVALLAIQMIALVIMTILSYLDRHKTVSELKVKMKEGLNMDLEIRRLSSVVGASRPQEKTADKNNANLDENPYIQHQDTKIRKRNLFRKVFITFQKSAVTILFIFPQFYALYKKDENIDWGLPLFFLLMQFAAHAVNIGMNLQAIFEYYEIDKKMQRIEDEISEREKQAYSILRRFKELSASDVKDVLSLRYYMGSTISGFPEDVMGDVPVYRYLEHAKFDVYKAGGFIRDFAEARLRYGIDEIRERIVALDYSFDKLPNFRALAGALPMNMNIGHFDLKGNMCYVINWGSCNVKKLQEFCHSPQAFLRKMLWVLELRNIILERSSLCYFKVLKFTGLINLQGCNDEHWQHFNYLKAVIEAENALYPGSCDALYLLNVSSNNESRKCATALKELMKGEKVNVVDLEGDWAHGPSKKILAERFKADMIGGTLNIGNEVTYKPLSLYETHSKLENYTNVEPDDIKKVLLMEHELAIEDPGTLLPSQITLLRYLLSSKGDRKEAIESAKEGLKMREVYDVDGMRQEIVEYDLSFDRLPGSEVLLEIYPMNFFLGFTKEGFPLTLERWGSIDITRLEKEYKSPGDFVEAYIWQYELLDIMLEKLAKSQKRLVQTVSLLDMASCSGSFAKKLLSSEHIKRRQKFGKKCFITGARSSMEFQS